MKMRFLTACFVGFFLVLVNWVAAADPQPLVCSLEVVNPTCKNGTQLPTSTDFPCITEAFCSTPEATSGQVNCLGWICSLRLNCACFAGQVTSCAANATNCSKDGCGQVASMFEEARCSFADFLGPRNSSSDYQLYLNQCLEGCTGGALTSTPNLILPLISLTAVLACTLLG